MNAQAPASLSPSRRAWLRFKRNRLGYWSLLVFCALVLVSLCAELVSNDRPLIVRYEGQTYFPMLKDYPEKTFGGDFETATDYLDPFIKERITGGSNWALYTLNPYGPNTLNYFAKAPNPSAPTADNWLGTDDRGRDLLAQLIYGFRVSVLFALALTVTGVVLGVVTGVALGVPQSARDVFALLAQAGRIEPPLAEGMQRMVGFRDIAVHDYQSLQLPITVAIIEKHLDEFLQHSKAILQRDAG